MMKKIKVIPNMAVLNKLPPNKLPAATAGLFVVKIPTIELVNSGIEETKATTVPAINTPENLVRFSVASTM
jgi:hypothetical protein